MPILRDTTANRCSECVYSLFSPLWICLSPRAKRDKRIDQKSECHCGDYTARQEGKLKTAMNIERLKDALRPKGE